MTAPLKIGVAGLGTVGGGVLKLLDTHADLLAGRSGRRMIVTAVSARTRGRDRGVDLSAARWYEDAAALAADPEVDVVVELIGGSEGIARELCEAALSRGKHVVTANKALLALHGTGLARLAEENGVALAFEAAVAGGIPVIKGLREGLAANGIKEVHGILNGTCNYILTEMRETGREFGDVLGDAQKLGYAEADPSFDIDGVDAAHKLAILTSVAFGCAVDFESVHIEGIRHISALDIDYARELGYRIKLLASRGATTAMSSSGSIRPWCQSIRRSRPSTACSTLWWPTGISSRKSLSSAAAPVQARPRRRSWPTSWTWRGAGSPRLSASRRGGLKASAPPRPRNAEVRTTCASWWSTAPA